MNVLKNIGFVMLMLLLAVILLGTPILFSVPGLVLLGIVTYRYFRSQGKTKSGDAQVAVPKG